MSDLRLFTSESVAEGHPDKIADCISDAVLDAALTLDKDVRVACETMVKGNLVVVAGEVGSNACPDIVEKINIEQLVREVIKGIGYTDPELGFDADSCKVLLALSEQSQDIVDGIHINNDNASDLGAGDQGLMFGYATNETDVFMPAPIRYAHLLMERHAEVRRSGLLPWLRPDAKSQVTLGYDADGKPGAIVRVVLSTQHQRQHAGQTLALAKLRQAVQEEIIRPVLGDACPPDDAIYVNPAGAFVIGGPAGDCGLTGRKIIVDTYGGMARHGGGAFSGKDPSKVDRSAAYVARYAAKNIVAAGLADKCEIQLSYAIGKTRPVAVSLHTFGTGKLPNNRIEELIQDGINFDLMPAGIIKMLDLKRAIYRPTAAYGHFGRPMFSWEKLDKVDALKAAAG